MIDTDQIINNLKSDYDLRERGRFLRGGRCPQCGKKKLFIEKANPMNLKCGRINNCGYSMPTRKLYPDCFKSLDETYPATEKEPHATANAYMKHIRGLETERCWEQGSRYEQEATTEIKGTTTVKFQIKEGVTWERYLIPIPTAENPDGKKAHFQGSYKGYWWQHPKQTIEYNDTVYLVEGIIDALSLIAAGKKAVSLMSCNNFPTESIKPHLKKHIEWRIALDNDNAGKQYAIAFKKQLEKRYEEARIICVEDTEKRDWNDIYKQGGDTAISTAITDAKYNGEVIAAPDSVEKAFAIVRQAENKGYVKKKFAFDFNDQWYWAKYQAATDQKAETVELQNICNCNPQFIYFQKDILTGEGAYYYKVTRRGSKTVYKEALNSAAHTSAANFKQSLANMGAGLMFTGTTQQLDNYTQAYWFSDPNPAEIQTINFLGYSKEFDAWIFKDHAIVNGKLIQPNEYEYFELPTGEGVKTTYKADPIKLSKKHDPKLWSEDFKAAYGTKGLVALAYWVGSYFAEQIREEIEKYPFLELSGDPGTGKTGILEFLWKLTGRNNYEGVELSKASHAGRWRTLEQAANLPVVLMEGDRGEGNQKKSFDLNEAKGLFNGRGMRITGIKNGGNETREPTFRAALVIAQNAQIESEPAVMERICQIHWDKSHFSEKGYHASNRLKQLDIGEVNGFMVTACSKADMIVPEFVEAFNRNYNHLNNQKELENIRIKETHAQLMALVEIMADFELCPLNENEINNTKDHIHNMALDRQKAVQNDPPELQEFWDAYEYLDIIGERPRVNHSKEQNLIAINLNQFESAAADLRISIAPKNTIKKLLSASRRYKFVEYKTVSSAINNKSTRCFVFEKSK